MTLSLSGVVERVMVALDSRPVEDDATALVSVAGSC